jgi:DnaJ-class molecular chaperone
MQNYYEILGLNNSATHDEVKRAYRILARRYHPDVNPDKDSGDKFKLIAEAYRVLSDQKKKNEFDQDFERFQRKSAEQKYREYTKRAAEEFKARSEEMSARSGAKAYEKASNQKVRSQPKKDSRRTAQPSTRQTPQQTAKTVLKNLKVLRQKATDFLNTEIGAKGKKKSRGPIQQPRAAQPTEPPPGHRTKSVRQVSIMEVSISMENAIFGVRKAIEIQERSGSRKVSVQIPPGTRPGAVIRMRSRNTRDEELVLIIRVAHHPFLTLAQKGLIVEIPITFNEALSGASISVPTLDDSVILKIPAGTQSGTELRLRGRGITLRDGGGREDLFFRVMIRLPDAAGAVGLKEKSAEIDKYYPEPVRTSIPSTLAEMARQ